MNRESLYIYLVKHKYDSAKKKVIVERSRLFVLKDVPFEAVELSLENFLKEKYGFNLQERRRNK